MSWLADAKHDQRPKRGAWAPGEYLHRACSECGSPFCGDKRAMECADCAYGKPSPVALNERDTQINKNPEGSGIWLIRQNGRTN